MAGWKQWQIGEVVEAADFQSYVQDQVVQVYADSAARGSALGTAVTEGMVAYLADTNSTEVYDGSSWIAVGAGDITSVTAGTGLTGGGTSGSVTLNVNQAALYTDGTAGYTVLSNGTAGLTYQPVSPNYIINGAFDIWQRGTSLSAAGYLADRFNSVATTSTVVQSQQSLTPANINAIGYGEGQFYLRQVVTSGNTAGSRYLLLVNIEDVRTLAGQTATLSFWARSGTGTPKIGVEFIQSFGAGGSSSVDTIGASAITISTSWTRYTTTVSIPSISGKTIGAGSFLGLVLWLDAGSDFASRASSIGNQSNTFDIWGVQLEAGSVATPFRRNANSLQGELAACQRYYFLALSGGLIFRYYNMRASSGGVTGQYQLPVTMRINPTISLTTDIADGSPTVPSDAFTTNAKDIFFLQNSVSSLDFADLRSVEASAEL